MSERVNDPIADDAVLVGSYSLETLTTGMYENPLHCIREYVQNAYDAIRAARGHGLSEAGGLVTVSISGTAARPTLSVKDDGTGIPEAEAVRTLVSIGASKKRPNINAGFRGIGRLAGVAYCTTLRFTTSAQGETTATVVEFDCGRMRGFMRPGADVQDVREVLRACVKTGTVPAEPAKHFTEVEMIGLIGIGLEFVEIERLVPYLRQVSPVDFSDRFTPAPRIRAFTESLGHPIGTVEVETRYKKERTQILKAYDNSTPISGGKASTIHNVELITSPDKGWHGWIGLSNFKGELTDDTVAGVRFRLKNIQVGGSEIIEDLGAELTVGGREEFERYRALIAQLDPEEKAALLTRLSSKDPSRYSELIEAEAEPKFKALLAFYLPISKDREREIWRVQRDLTDEIDDVCDMPDDERVEDAGLNDDAEASVNGLAA